MREVPDVVDRFGQTLPENRGVGVGGDKINFNRCLYGYTPARPLALIQADICGIGLDISQTAAEVNRSATE